MKNSKGRKPSPAPAQLSEQFAKVANELQSLLAATTSFDDRASFIQVLDEFSCGPDLRLHFGCIAIRAASLGCSAAPLLESRQAAARWFLDKALSGGFEPRTLKWDLLNELSCFAVLFEEIERGALRVSSNDIIKLFAQSAAVLIAAGRAVASLQAHGKRLDTAKLSHDPRRWHMAARRDEIRKIFDETKLKGSRHRCAKWIVEKELLPKDLRASIDTITDDLKTLRLPSKTG